MSPARWAALFALTLAVFPGSALADGQLDPSFGSGGRLDLSLETSSGVEGASSLLQLGDGRFLSVGAGKGSGVWVVQHQASGALDGGFGTAGATYFGLSSYAFASDAVREPNGSIVIAGGKLAVPYFDTMVARLTPQGALDPSFGNDPPNPTGDGISVYDLGSDDLAEGVVLDSSGRAVIAGRVGPPGAHDVLLARFNSDGSIDPTFGGPTGVHTDLGGDDKGVDVAMQGDRFVVLAKSGAETKVLRYLPGGTLDPSFGGGDGIAPVSFPASTEPNALLVQPDGRIVVAGSEPAHALIARLQSDGSPDSSFGSGGVTSFDTPAGAAELYVSALAESDDGRIVVAGTTYGAPNSQVTLLRLLPNGQPDPAWGTNGLLAIPPPPETSESAFTVAVQPDRRVLVGGNTYSNGNDDRLLMRLLGDTSPPDTAITLAPKAKSRSPLHSATFGFEALGDVHTTFQCELSRPRHHRRHHHHHRHHRRRPGARVAAVAPEFTGCTSPVTYSRLRTPGRYTFQVRAIDPAGNVDPTPASAGFRVLAKRHKHKHHHHHH